MADKKQVKSKEITAAHKKETSNKKDVNKRHDFWQLFFYIIFLIAWTGVAVIASQLVIGYIMIWILGAEGFNQPLSTTIFMALSYILALVLVVFVPPKLRMGWELLRKKPQKKDKNRKILNRSLLGLKGWPTWTDIGLALVGFLAYLVLASGITALFSGFSWFDAGETQEIGFSLYLSGVDRMIAFFALVVVAPIAEEIIFRGWLYGKLRAKLSEKVSNITGMIISIILVSLLFGVVHLQWNVGVNVFALSVVLCGLREVTGTIYSGMLLHMLKNGVAFYMLYVLGV